jgi:hypothetical protein
VLHEYAQISEQFISRFLIQKARHSARTNTWSCSSLVFIACVAARTLVLVRVLTSPAANVSIETRSCANRASRALSAVTGALDGRARMTRSPARNGCGSSTQTSAPLSSSSRPVQSSRAALPWPGIASCASCHRTAGPASRAIRRSIALACSRTAIAMRARHAQTPAVFAGAQHV